MIARFVRDIAIIGVRDRASELDRKEKSSLIHLDIERIELKELSSSGPGPRSGPGQVPGQVQKVQGLRTKDLDLG